MVDGVHHNPKASVIDEFGIHLKNQLFLQKRPLTEMENMVNITPAKHQVSVAIGSMLPYWC